jgi:alkaline phosphatase
MKNILIFIFALFCVQLQAQEVTPSRAHSHNDYLQQSPFHLAYNEMFGSIEADIHLINNKILVGHDTKDLDSAKTLEKLYLETMVAYNLQNRKLQLLIDIKTEAISTIDRLVQVLNKYPSIIKNKNIKIVLSGNAPPDSTFKNYQILYGLMEGSTKIIQQLSCQKLL